MWCRLKPTTQTQNPVLTAGVKEASVHPGVISADPFAAGPAAELTFRLGVAAVSARVSDARLPHPSE